MMWQRGEKRSAGHGVALGQGNEKKVSKPGSKELGQGRSHGCCARVRSGSQPHDVRASGNLATKTTLGARYNGGTYDQGSARAAAGWMGHLHVHVHAQGRSDGVL
eukprot:364297-Chlamydomonas_euryale.AAC.7